MLLIFATLMLHTTATVVREVQHTSTNGSFVAGLGCDGDLNTFSLTNNGVKQSWSATLDKEYQISWIYVRIEAGSYRITVQLEATSHLDCAHLIKTPGKETDIFEKILTCSYDTEEYKWGNKINIHKEEEGSLKIFEVKIMGIDQINQSMLRNYPSFPETSKVLDNNLNTFYHTNKKNNASWFLHLDVEYEIKWILISIRGGAHELHITTKKEEISSSTLCKSINLTGIKQHQRAVECVRAMRGDTIIVKKTDGGSLRLFELHPIICPLKHYGPSCARCSKKCQSCNPVTGKCTQCPASFYGDECQYNCPENCLDLVCDQTTGVCNSCKDGYEGLQCEQKTTTSVITTEQQTYTQGRYCHHSCVTCFRDPRVCMLCDQHLETDVCKYRCREICSGEISCQGIQGNCTREEENKYSKADTTAAVVREAHQTSTNGSFVAGLGCDGDLNTFSLTSDSENQSWSAALDKTYDISWIFVRIKAGAFKLSIGLHTAKPNTCVDISKPSEENTSNIEEILACTDSHHKGNQITIDKTDEGALKIYEIKIMGISQLDDTVYENYTQFPYKSPALDNNLNTYHHIDVDSGAVWFLRLNLMYEIKWILISIRGGNYEVHITTDDTLTNASTLCKEFRFLDIKQHQITIECKRAMRGNIIIVRKMDVGSLRLFELYPIICPSNRYGPACIKCPTKCRTCDSVTGKCVQCSVSFYGDNCQHSCPQHCLDLVCDQTTGICNGCREGHEGQHCEFEITTSLSNSVSAFHSKEKILKTATEMADSESGNDITHSALLSCLMVLLAVLVVVVIMLFVKRRQRLNTVYENDVELEVTTNNLELEEIAQNETGDLEEEVLVVEYSNLTSQRVPIGQFLEDLPSRKEEGALEKEFDELPFGLLENYSNAVKSSNRNRNRYKGIYPYDYNGVKLRNELEETEDYVNASYIHGFNKEKYYIAAQGPFNPWTLEDFWEMIWQTNSSKIVMLTNLYENDKMKCLKYWPDIDCTIEIGCFSILMENEDVFDSYVVRKMCLRYQEETRLVTQFHFTAWPDNSVPQDVTTLIRFWNLVRSALTNNNEPIVVHCSAGIGRTGTYIALDYLLEECDVDMTVDVKGYVISLRHQRGKCIQTREQYIFLHEALAVGLKRNNVQQPINVQEQQSINVQQHCLAVL